LSGTAEDVFSIQEMLADPELDAVMIRTERSSARENPGRSRPRGKDCYCEKPMANTLDDATLAREAVRSSKQVRAMGSQWLSCPYQQRVREIVRSAKLGKIVSISQSWNFNGPRCTCRRTRTSPRSATGHDWSDGSSNGLSVRSIARLLRFRIFRIFVAASRISGYSHGSGSRISISTRSSPTTPSSNAGLSRGTTARESGHVSMRVDLREGNEVLYSYSTTFGNAHGDHTIIRGTRGTLYSPAARQPAVVVGPGEPQPVGIERRLRPAREQIQAGAGLLPGQDRRRAGQTGRQPESAHRQLARVHAQPSNAERTHRTGSRTPSP